MVNDILTSFKLLRCCFEYEIVNIGKYNNTMKQQKNTCNTLKTTIVKTIKNKDQSKCDIPMKRTIDII